MSKTPRTDALLLTDTSPRETWFSVVDLSRQLESENAEMADALDRLCSAISQRAAALVTSQSESACEYADKQMWRAHKEARALLAKINGDA